MAKDKSGRTAGSGDVPKDAKEGKAVQRDEKNINELNKSDMSAAEKLRKLLEEDE